MQEIKLAIAGKIGSAQARMGSEEPVAVIIAAYNAEETIDDTLRSVRAQTYPALEVIVVDDGSSDNTSAIVQKHAEVDARIRLIRQTNSGVAAARNRAIAEARSEYVAPIDADDLWSPTKIDKQMKAMRDRGSNVALVYTWLAIIDRKGAVVSNANRPDDEGNVLPRMCLGNLVGNASSALMRRSVAIECGGYDPSLRLQNAQGCEDWKLYLRIAERYEFAVVREYLTLYRIIPGSMTSDTLQMLRSHDLVLSEFSRRHPEYAQQFHESRNRMLRWLIRRAVSSVDPVSTVVLMMKLFEHDYRYGLSVALEPLVRLPLRIRSKQAD